MPATGTFDPIFPTHLTGSITNVTVHDTDGTRNRVLELDRPWGATVEWQLSSDAPDTDPANTLGGTWFVRLIVESMGEGQEQTIGNHNEPFGPPPGSSDALAQWSHTFDFPVGAITREAVYKLVTLITYRGPLGDRKAMAGFREGPLVTFYRD